MGSGGSERGEGVAGGLLKRMRAGWGAWKGVREQLGALEMGWGGSWGTWRGVGGEPQRVKVRLGGLERGWGAPKMD